VIADLAPGAVVTAVTETVGEVGHLLHVGPALGLVAGLFGPDKDVWRQ
jgi:hypothetical protein